MKTPILIAMIAYMAMVVYIGVIYSKKNKTSEDYFLGGRGLGPWVTAMSAEASDMSSWLLMGLTLWRQSSYPREGIKNSNCIRCQSYDIILSEKDQVKRLGLIF